MRFMNEYDVEEAVDVFDAGLVPRRAAAARVVYRLMKWTNRNSDGWAYWPKPARAAAKAMELIDPTDWVSRQRYEETDCTDEELTKALAPVKAFLTRQKVPLEVLDLEPGYRWATADETESFAAGTQRGLVINRTFDSTGRPYLQLEADVAVPTT